MFKAIMKWFKGPYRPCQKEFFEISCREYRHPEYNCTAFSADFAQVLNDHGIRANVVTGDCRGDGFHAWVQYRDEDGKIYNCDPTWGEWNVKMHHRTVTNIFKEGASGHAVFTMDPDWILEDLT